MSFLGEKVNQTFGGLPYLFKVLDAEKMLSIQAHPNPEQARAGFAHENALGVPLNAPHRNYKDPNSKPEVHVALTDFYMLHGFKPLSEIYRTFEEIPAFKVLPKKPSLKDLYTHLMKMEQSEVNRILNRLFSELPPDETPLSRDNPHYWAIRAARDFARADGSRDRGIFSIYILNLLHLKPGQGTFQGAGELHAYLEGVNMELMANSDNVLRGGLTPKHIEVSELLKGLSFSDKKPQILQGELTAKEGSRETVYKTSAREFELSRIELTDKPYARTSCFSAEIILMTEGQAQISAGQDNISFKKGDCIWVSAATSYELRGSGILFKASVPEF